MNNTELIKELKDCIALHMNPYNLGDMGRTTELIIEACNRLQKLKQCNVSGALPLDEFINEVERMQKLYSNSRYTAAEELRDRLSEQLDDIMRLGGNDR